VLQRAQIILPKIVMSLRIAVEQIDVLLMPTVLRGELAVGVVSVNSQEDCYKVLQHAQIILRKIVMSLRIVLEQIDVLLMPTVLRRELVVVVIFANFHESYYKITVTNLSLIYLNNIDN